MTGTKAADIDVASISDRGNCWITGSAVLSNNRIIMVDYKNNKVKLAYSHSHGLLCELKVSAWPWDVAVMNKDQAAVTLPYREKILILKVTDTLSEEREITVSGDCHGVAYSQDRLFVTFVKYPRLEIIDLYGNLIRTIVYGSERFGSRLFGRPDYVCVSKDGETIYVSDVSGDTVKSLTDAGVVKSVYTDEGLIGPRKMCTDHDGNIYVCGYHSRTVHMITADCGKVKAFLTQADGLDSNVWSVSYCQDTNGLFIGIHDNNGLKVYQLS